ncbi:MAG: DUF4870 domain-containing protein [Thermoguttaceae bacterium]|jgi:uncharacterized Tic20 family protein
MNVADELEKLQRLHESGGISDEEFARAKDRLLTSPAGGLDSLFRSGGSVEQQTRQWAMFLHLSQLACLVLPLAGLIVPILIWQMKKTDLPGLDEHGKIVVNWIISEILYCIVLAITFIGIFLVPVVLAVGIIVFPIIGGIKANNGEVWKYPLSIPFFK